MDTRTKIPANKEEYIAFFDNLPDECTRNYELKLTEIVKSGKVQQHILFELIEEYKDTLESKIGYAAFYCLTIVYRNNVDDLQKLFDDYREHFESYNSFIHLDVLRYIYGMKDHETVDEIYLIKDYKFASGFNYNKKNNEGEFFNIGFCHAFADLFATVCEQDEESSLDLIKKWYKKALHMVNLAIEKSEERGTPYAKYYCTKGRILLLKKQYQEANSLVRKAINIESPSDAYYAKKISEYHHYLFQIELKKQLEILHGSSKELQDQMASLRKSSLSNIEILTFFCAAISFIIGSFSLAKDQDTFSACLLIITLMGCLLSVFTLFTLVLHLNDPGYKKAANIIIALVGIVIVIVTTMIANDSFISNIQGSLGILQLLLQKI